MHVVVWWLDWLESKPIDGFFLCTCAGKQQELSKSLYRFLLVIAVLAQAVMAALLTSAQFRSEDYYGSVVRADKGSASVALLHACRCVNDRVYVCVCWRV